MSSSLFKSVLVVACLSCWLAQSAVAQQNVTTPESAPLKLTACDLASGAQPESQLPTGAIAHIRINGLQSLLDDTSAMAFPFVPEKIIGEPAMVAKQQENPLLALIGMAAMGGPIGVEQLSDLTGLDPQRAVTASYYFMGPESTYVLSLPVKNLDTVSGLLTNIMDRNVPAKEITVADATVQHIMVGGLDTYVLASADRIWATGKLAVINAILSDSAPRMDATGIVPEMVQKHAGDNVLVILNPAPLKPFLGMAGQYRTLPPQLIESLRGQAEGELSENDRAQVEKFLQTWLGIDSVTQALDYAECIAQGVYEPVVRELLDSLGQFNGFVLAIDVDEEFQRFQFSVLSDAIVAPDEKGSLSEAQIQGVIKQLPGSHNRVVLSAKTPGPEKSELLGEVIATIGQLMIDKNLPMSLHEKVTQLWEGHAPVVPLSASVDWLAQTSFFSGRRPGEFESLAAFLEQGTQESQFVNLEICPRQEDGFIEDHFQQMAGQVTANNENWRRFMLGINAASSISQHSESSAKNLSGDVTQLIYQDHYLLHHGFFGYQQHELINRQFTLMRHFPNQTVLWRGGMSPSLLVKLQPKDAVAPAIDRLISNSRMPETIRHVEVTRMAGTAVALVDWLAELETLIHDEMETYLQRSQKIVDGYTGNDLDELKRMLSENDMPMLVSQLSAIKRRLLLVTPVGLAYPRPKLVPEIAVLLADHRAASETAGGALMFCHTATGRHDVTTVFSTAAASSLTRSVGNAIADRYMADPDAMDKLQSKLITELDRGAEDARPLISNDTWGDTQIWKEAFRNIEQLQ